MAARAQVPILLLTRFLGSGKASLLARWLKSPESMQSAPGEALERAAYVALKGGKPPRTGLTIIARSASAEEIASFIAARLAISAMQATTHSTGARA